LSRRAVIPLHVGGFLGPFGGGVLPVLIPQLRDEFHASSAAVTFAIPAYLVPFALCLLVSGTIGERLGRRRVVRVAYVVYAASMLGSAFAPTLLVFNVARAFQGVSNAFTTPLLMAGLADVVPAAALGRSIGTFAGVQAGAVSFAPLIGGLCGAVSWRLAFIAPAIVALVLVLVPPPRGAGAAGADANLRSLVDRRVGLLCAGAFVGYLCLTGLAFLVALRAADALALGSVARGLVVATYGAAGLALGSFGGRLVVRVGTVRTASLGAIVSAVFVAPLGVASSAFSLAALWTLAGAGSALVWAGLNTAAVEAVPSNRSGAVSVFSSFKFLGNAAGPLVWLPLYDRAAGLPFAVAAAVSLTIPAIAARLGVTPRAS
jgi:MFS family permease